MKKEDFEWLKLWFYEITVEYEKLMKQAGKEGIILNPKDGLLEAINIASKGYPPPIDEDKKLICPKYGGPTVMLVGCQKCNKHIKPPYYAKEPPK